MIKIKICKKVGEGYEIDFPSKGETRSLFLKLIRSNGFKISPNDNDIQIISKTRDEELKTDILHFTNNEEILIRDKKYNENFPLSFSNMTEEEHKEIEVEDDESIPDYLTINPGINLIGICDYIKCDAYGKEVVGNIEENEYVIIKNRGIVKCPKCNNNVIGKTIAFFSCYYNFYGTKINKNKQIENFGKKIENFQNIEIPFNNKININGESYEIHKTKDNIISYYYSDDKILYLELVLQVKKINLD